MYRGARHFVYVVRGGPCERQGGARGSIFAPCARIGKPGHPVDIEPPNVANHEEGNEQCPHHRAVEVWSVQVSVARVAARRIWRRGVIWKRHRRNAPASGEHHSAIKAINCGRVVGQRSTSGHRGSASAGKRQNELHRGKQYTEHEESRVSRLWLPPETPQVNEPNDPPFPKRAPTRLSCYRVTGRPLASVFRAGATGRAPLRRPPTCHRRLLAGSASCSVRSLALW